MFTDNIYPDSHMLTFVIMAPPPQWTDFLHKYPNQMGGEPTLVPFSTDIMLDAAVINRKVNAITYRREERDRWDIADLETLKPLPHGFDCEDAALTKRALLAKKIPMGALRPALCTTWEHHMVLLLCTDKGEFVMDISSNFLIPWNRYQCHWLARWNGVSWTRIVNRH